MGKIPTFEACCDQYIALWSHMAVHPNFEAEAKEIAARIIANALRYKVVERATGAPWYFIGVLHNMECGGSFRKHLHNGDSLDHPTVNVPAGRPATPGPWSWETSAIDAINIKKLSGIHGWALDRIAYECERFNGFGYRMYHSTVPTPYLWSGTNHYTCGKYAADSQFDPYLTSKQIGCMPVLRALIEAGVEVNTPPPAEAPVCEPITEASYPRAHPEEAKKSESSTLWAAGSGGLLAAAEVVHQVSNVTNEAKSSGLLDVTIAAFSSTTILLLAVLLALLALIFKERLLKFIGREHLL